MKWIKYNSMKSETEPPLHDLVLTAYTNKNGVWIYVVSRYVSNDFPHYENNLHWTIIDKPSN
jgi:hypothetical protein